MVSELQSMPAEPGREFAELTRLRQFTGTPKEFWTRFAVCLADLSGASRVVIATRKTTESGPVWQRVMEHSRYSGPASVNQAFGRLLEDLDALSGDGSVSVKPLEDRSHRPAEHHVAVLVFDLDAAAERCLGVFLLAQMGIAAAQDATRRLRLAADTPRLYLQARASLQAREDVQKFAVVLDLLVEVNAAKRFLAAALALVNELATRLECDRVSLGWLERGYVRLRAISRVETFDRRMAAAEALETVMEEALDQDEDMVYPPPDAARWVIRDHERYAAEQRAGNLCSFPIRDGAKPVGVLTAERAARPFSFEELRQFRLVLDLAARRLIELKGRDRWFGARWLEWAREKMAWVLGPEHTWAKLLALVITALLAVLFFGRFDYRVEGTFRLRSDETVFLTAPYDGYLKEVQVRPGDVVPAGAPLAGLNTEELELEETAALADWVRYQREAEKAKASGALADMRIAEALSRQAEARLGLIRHRLRHALLRVPFPGVVIEGDLRERLGAPVRQGDALFQVARLDTLYVEAEVSERDIHEVLGRETGEIAFVSQPQLKFPVKIVRIEPAAVGGKAENTFLVRCAPAGPTESWWRPGMSGVCKLNVGKRTLIWILTHRTVDFLRMFLWW
jgi:hypothetical protein